MFEMFQLPFMVQAFAAAAITGILLSYLGVHVVGRGIVFVDLALGQISSLGVAFAAFIGAQKIVNLQRRFAEELVGALLLGVAGGQGLDPGALFRQEARVLPVALPI